MSGQLELASGGGVLVLEIGLSKALRHDYAWYHCPILPPAKAVAGSLKDPPNKKSRLMSAPAKPPARNLVTSPRDDVSCSKQQAMCSLTRYFAGIITPTIGNS